MLSIQQKFINYNKSKRNSPPSYIVVHDTGDPGATAQNEHNYFSGGDRQASADFFVDSNNIIQIIDTDNYYSWQVGDGRGAYGISNSNSVGIEMCLDSSGNPTNATISNTIDLVKYLMSKYNISADKVVRHYDASRKSCPNSFSSNNWSKWNDFKSKLVQEKIVVPKNDKLKKQIEALEYWLNVDYNAKLTHTDGTYTEEELYLNLEAVGKLIVKSHKSNLVKWIQQKLIIWGFLGSGQDTGIYDEKTFQAVTNLQKAWDRETSGKILISNNTWQIFLGN